MEYLYLSLAIIAEVIATSTLKATEGFTRLWPSVIVVLGYMASFWWLSLTLKTLPVGIVYAIWSGVGIVLVAAAAWVFYRQQLDLPALFGIGLILLGVLVINVFSRSVPH